MSIFGRINKAINGEANLYDDSGYARTQSAYCEHCHCNTLTIHNHKSEEQYRRMLSLVKRINL